MFLALCKRRNVRIRYERYASSISAAAIYNVNRHSNDDPVVKAFDFVRDDESIFKLEKLRKAKRYVKKAIGEMPWKSTSRQQYLAKRLVIISDLKADGYADAEQIFNVCWPNLTPTEEDK